MKYILHRIISLPLGMHPLMTGDALRLFKDDFILEKRTRLKEKLWAWRRGFISGRILDYGLDESNYRDYLSDWAYFRLYPLNNKDYSAWIDDKLTTRLVLTKYSQYLPGYYFSIQNGTVYPSVDQVGETMADLFRILQEKGALAFKKESGSFGKGFYKVEGRAEEFLVNNQPYTRDELLELIRSLDGYLVTEFIRPHGTIARVYPKAANTIRLMVIKEEDQPAFLANAFIRFGTDQSGGVDNAASGVIAAVLDLESGQFDKGCLITAEGLRLVEHHPDTGARIQGTIPGWEALVVQVLEMTDYLGKLSWLGYDIVVTEDSFQILEINSHQNVRTIQYFYPLLKSNPASAYLSRELQRKNLK